MTRTRKPLWRAALVATLAVLSLAACPAATVLAGEPLRIAIEGEYPPFSYVDGNGNLAGFDVDIALAVCREMQADCELVKTPWEGIIDRLERGDFDVIVASMSYTPERAERVEFTQKYYRTTSSYVVLQGSEFDPSPEGVRGSRVATQEETVHAAYLQATYGDTIVLMLTDTIDQAYALLTTGEADAVLANTLVDFAFLQSEAGAQCDYAGEPLSEQSLSSTANIAVRKGETELRDAIDAALVRINESGEYDRINRAYFPFSIY